MNLFSRRPPRTPAPAAVQPAPTDAALDGALGDASACGWFASSAELHRGLSVTELEIAPADFAAAWRRWVVAEAGAGRNPVCRAGARG